MAFKKVTKSDFGYNLENIKDAEQKSFMENILGAMCDVVNKAMEGAITAEDMKTQFESINEQLKGYDAEKFAQVVKDNEELRDMLKDAMESIQKAKEIGAMDRVNKFDEMLNEMFDSEKFKEFADGHTRKSGVFGGFKMKDIVSMTDDYTGDILISRQLPNVVSPYSNRRLHMRDVISVLQGDPNFPQLTFAEITNLDRNARYHTENGRLSESSFQVKENSVSTKRLGTFVHISKRMLKSRVYVRSYILATLPDAVLRAEDAGILFGDGNGENLDGIANKNGVVPVETIVSGPIVTGAAGSVKSCEPYNGGVDALVEFTNAQPLILDGMKITFAGATDNASLNGTHDVIKVNDRQIIVRGIGATTAVTTETAAHCGAITFTVKSAAYQSVTLPNSLDVIKTAFAVMTYAQYAPNAIVLNPLTVNAIECEKDTTGRNLGLVQMNGGVKTIAGRPIVEYDGIPVGMYLIGDFSVNGCSIVDYTNLNLEWAEDVEDKLTNSVHLIAQEEIIFPIYNPWAFAYGSLAALKTAITKPA